MEPEFSINELTWFEATFSFQDLDGGDVIPATVRWKLHNVTEDVEAQAWAALTPAAQIVLNVSAQLLTIENIANPKELYQLVIDADAGLATEQLKSVFFDVLNVANV